MSARVVSLTTPSTHRHRPTETVTDHFPLRGDLVHADVLDKGGEAFVQPQVVPPG